MRLIRWYKKTNSGIHDFISIYVFALLEVLSLYAVHPKVLLMTKGILKGAYKQPFLME